LNTFPLYMNKLAEYLRNKLFWMIDALKGGQVKTHRKDIANILENFDSPASIDRRDTLLKNLLIHASETTPYYQKYANSKKLQDFPVVNKTIIRDNFEAFQSSLYKDKPQFQISTSGSSGTPFKAYWDKNKVLRNRADTIYFQGITGYEIGQRLYYIRKWLSKYKGSKLTMAMRNIEMVNVSDFSDDYLANLIKTLETDSSTKMLLSYSSALRDICNYLQKIKAGPVNSDITSIIAMADELGDDTRIKLNYYFNAPVHLRYSNQENGILSLQLSQENNTLQINWASYFIEVLHLDEDIPVAEGTLGRVVVTDLFNYGMPFIRYDTGDLAILTREGAYFNTSSVFKSIEGRKMDVLRDTKGNVISGFSIHHLETYPEIKQFQFVQQSSTMYCINLVVSQPVGKEFEIIEYFRDFLGSDAEIKIAYVDEIPKLNSGKRKLIVNTTT